MARKIALMLASAAFLAAAAPAQAATDQERLATYKHRVDLLEDQADVENLQATFGFYFDKGLWDQAASLFARNGTFEYEQRGVYVGPARIQRAMLLFGPQGLAAGHLNNHMMLQNVTIIAEDGKTATARWQGPIMLSAPGTTGEWAVGIYENAYVKEGGVWK
ncbi:MAG TPA: nuclear transport factor 2 family protein, partial [Croceibacterium sp.]|nr:nuclear transport factor 2 family protein [Croceibacterium sp.]